VLNVTEPPVQRLSVPEAEMVALGSGLTVSVRDAETEQPEPFEIVHVYVPAVVKLEITAVLAVKLFGPAQL
jgi:hypothetical protein